MGIKIDTLSSRVFDEELLTRCSPSCIPFPGIGLRETAQTVYVFCCHGLAPPHTLSGGEGFERIYSVSYGSHYIDEDGVKICTGATWTMTNPCEVYVGADEGAYTTEQLEDMLQSGEAFFAGFLYVRQGPAKNCTIEVDGDVCDDAIHVETDIRTLGTARGTGVSYGAFAWNGNSFSQGLGVRGEMELRYVDSASVEAYTGGFYGQVHANQLAPAINTVTADPLGFLAGVLRRETVAEGLDVLLNCANVEITALLAYDQITYPSGGGGEDSSGEGPSVVLGYAPGTVWQGGPSDDRWYLRVGFVSGPVALPNRPAPTLATPGRWADWRVKATSPPCVNSCAAIEIDNRTKPLTVRE